MVLKTVKLGVVGKIGSYLPDAALTPYPAYVQHVTPGRIDAASVASGNVCPVLESRFHKQKIPVTILYILLFSVVQRLCYIREVMTHKEYDFFTAVHRTKGKNDCDCRHLASRRKLTAVAPFLAGIQNEEQYTQALELVDHLLLDHLKTPCWIWCVPK